MKNKNYKLIGMSVGIVLLLVLSMWSVLAAAPVIGAITDQKATVDEEFTLTVVATDADAADKDKLVILEADSSLGFLKVDATNKLKLVGTPAQAGDVTVKVVVSDPANEKSTAVSFKITVKTPLEMKKKDAAFVVEVGSTKYAGDKQDLTKTSLKVAPGDKVKVTVPYGNNFVKELLGYVELVSKSNLVNDFTASTIKVWAVKPGSYTGTVEFTVPATILDDKFTVNVKVADETASGKKYGDSIDLSFNVVKKEKNAIIDSVVISDEVLTCVKTTSMDVKLLNNGKNDLAAELWILNQPATSIGVDGKLVTSASVKVHYPDDFVGVNPAKIKAGAAGTYSIPVNLSSVTGVQTLYVYAISPWFTNDGGASFYFSDYKQVTVKNVGACLKMDAVQNALVIAKNAPAEKTVDLFAKADGKYVFIDEDKDYEKTLSFSIAKDKDGKELQTNIDLISCKVNVDGHTVSCAKPAANKEGTSDVTLKVDESALKSSFTEKVTVKVAPILKLSVNNVNGKNAGDLEKAPLAVSPLDTLIINYDLGNSLDEKLINGAVSLKSPFNFQTKNIFFLKNKDDTTLKGKTFTVQIPATVIDGTYELTLVADAVTDLENTLYQDSYTFSVKVKQKADLQVSVSTKEKDNTIACKSDTAVDVKVINIGKVEKKGVISVKEGEKVHEKSSFTVGPAGKSSTTTFTLPVTSAGKHTYTIVVDYDVNKEAELELPASTVTKTIDITKEGCLDKTSALPAAKNLVTAESVKTTFSVKTTKLGFDNAVKWFVNDQEMATGLTFEFTPVKTSEYKVKAKLNGEETDVWILKVSNVPVADKLKTNIKGTESKQELAAFDALSVESKTASVGKIEFNQKVDLTKVLDLDKAITIVDGSIGVDSVNFPDLNKPAKITVYKSFTTPVILKTDEKGGQTVCTAPTCTIVTNANNLFVFTVNGFSTYKVIEKQSVGIELSTIAMIQNVDLGNTTTFSFTVKNTGSTESLTNVKVDLSGIPAKYKAKVIDDVDGTIVAQKTDTVKVEFTVPKDEEGGKHEMGSIKITSAEVAAGAVQKVYLSPKSYLRINSVEVKGKESGKFSLSEPTEFKVEIVNDFTFDLTDVFVTVTVLDVDGDDLDEESESMDIDKGDSEDFKVEFDLSKEVVDEDSYVVEFTVEGEDDNGATHKMTETKTVNVDREKHKVVMKQASVSEEELSCTRATTVRVELENQGKNKEDDVVVKVKNSALKLEVKKEKIELDKFSGDDNDYVAVLAVDAGNVAAGSYPLSVEVYLEGALVDTKTVTLNVKDCGSLTSSNTSKGQQTLVSNEEAKAQSVALQQQLQTKVQADAQKVVKGSFREQDSYILLLGVLAILVFIALVLALAVVVIKKK